MKLTYIILGFIFSAFLSACGGGGKSFSGGGNSNDYRGQFISSSLIDSRRTIPYKTKAYKITYYTVGVDGSKIKASGLLAIPQKDKNEKSPLLSYQHGTIFLNEQAPSKSHSTADAIMTFAGFGYIISAPDYIGYGESFGQIHPYIQANTLASASLDMLRASKQFLQSQKIKINKQLFLAGYSEGGYATLALQKSIQQEYASEFTVTASASGAGPYDLTGTATFLANQENNGHPAYMSFLLKAYDTVYHLNKISDMYQSPYIDVVNTVFDGLHSSGTINSSLTNTTADLFEPDFLAALQGTEDHVIKEKLALNNIYDWKPDAPTRFFHSPNDEVVPYANSQKALSVMRANGANSVSLRDCPFNSHVDCALPYILDTRNFFARYVDDL